MGGISEAMVEKRNLPLRSKDAQLGRDNFRYSQSPRQFPLVNHSALLSNFPYLQYPVDSSRPYPNFTGFC